MTILQKLKVIEKAKCIYNIHYCKAGVGFVFYEEELPLGLVSKRFRDRLTIHKYYSTFTQAVNGEYKRLKT